MNDTEDADLELLRQAALSSLLKKKNVPSTTNALFYNPSAKPNLISIEPVKEECFEDESTEFATEYVIAEGLSVSSDDVDEIVEEVIVSEDDEENGDAEGEEGSSSEGEDAVSVASKDSFDEILNSIEEEVKDKDSKSTEKNKLNVVKRRPADTSSSSNRGKQTDKSSNSTRNPPSNRNRSWSPADRDRRPPPRRPLHNSRKSPPLRYSQRRRTRSRSPPLRRRTRSPGEDRRDLPSSLGDNRRRTNTRSPAENRIPRLRSPIDSKTTRSPIDDRRLRGSQDNRRHRSRSPRRRSRTPPGANRRLRSRSPFVHENRRRRSRSPYRRSVVENNRRYGRRSRSRSPLRNSSLDVRKQSPKSPVGSDSKISTTGSELRVEKKTNEGNDNVDSGHPSSRKSSPENKKLSEALKLNSRTVKVEKEPYRKRSAEYYRSSAGYRDRRSRSRSSDRNRRGQEHGRFSQNEKTSIRKRIQSRSPGITKRKPRTRTPSPQLQNLSKEEREIFEKRKQKFQANVNVNKLSGKITLKTSKTDLPNRQDKNGSQNSSSNNHISHNERTRDRVNVSDKKSGLSSRLGDIVPDEESQSNSEHSSPVIHVASSSLLDPDGLDDPGSSPSQGDETKEDLRTKLQQKRATGGGIGRLFTVAIQDTLSTSSSDESPHKSRRKVSTSFSSS